MMLNPNTTNVQWQLWKEQYEETKQTEEEKFYADLKRDPTKMRHYIRDLAEIQRILESGNGLADWAMAPEMVGYLFMEDRLKTSLLRATNIVRDVANKEWVKQEELIVVENESVLDAFVELVSYFVILYSTASFSSRVLDKGFREQQEDTKRRLVLRFKHLAPGISTKDMYFKTTTGRHYDEFAGTDVYYFQCLLIMCTF